MAYDLHLAERIAQNLKSKHINFYEKRMFGGTCFMVNDKMCIGIVKNNLMARVDPNEEVALLQKPGAGPMEFTGKAMKGYLFISDEGWDADDDLSFWVDKCLEFNPLAKASKPKK